MQNAIRQRISRRLRRPRKVSIPGLMRKSSSTSANIQRLALDLLLYTGQRKSDIVLFGSKHVKDGWLRFTQQKNRNSKPVTLEIPILPQLAATIAATPSGHLTFLVSKLGKPFSVAGFGMRFRDWCDAAGLPECTAHGLRKIAAVRTAQNGATPAQLMAIFGWRDIKQAELYTRAADQNGLPVIACTSSAAGTNPELMCPTFRYGARREGHKR